MSAIGVILICIQQSQLPAVASAAEIHTKPLAVKLVDLTGINQGLCAVLGGDRDLPVEMVQASNLVIHVREPD